MQTSNVSNHPCCPSTPRVSSCLNCFTQTQNSVTSCSHLGFWDCFNVSPIRLPQSSTIRLEWSFLGLLPAIILLVQYLEVCPSVPFSESLVNSNMMLDDYIQPSLKNTAGRSQESFQVSALEPGLIILVISPASNRVYQCLSLSIRYHDCQTIYSQIITSLASLTERLSSMLERLLSSKNWSHARSICSLCATNSAR